MKFIRKRPMTLMELLVVVGIIALLAGILIPTIFKSLNNGYRLNCMSNLKQIGLAMQSYKNDYRRKMPPWISTLYSSTNNTNNYIKAVDVYHCELDENASGTPADEWECTRFGDSYSNAFDREGNTGVSGATPNSQLFDKLNKVLDVNGMSYFYEFSDAPVPTTWGWIGPTWYDQKISTIKHESNPNTHIPYCSQLDLFPIVRCSWHWKQAADAPYINLSFSGNVFLSKAKWETGVWTP